jgi:hypothetical protein
VNPSHRCLTAFEPNNPHGERVQTHDKEKHPLMDVKHKLAAGAGALALLGLGSLGLGVANAQSTPPPASSTAPDTATTPEGPEAADATEAPEAPEAADTTPDDPNGHADAAGADVQNEGGPTER